jgi:hypothetical protein
MPRLVSLTALLVAMTAIPATAADWGDDGGDWDVEYGDMRGSYFNEPKDWSGLGDEDDGVGFEFGLRYWYSWGSQSVDAGSGPTTATDNSHIGEAHLRIEDYTSNVYAKAIVGYSFATTGSFTSASGNGTIGDGTIAYWGADIGWNPWGDGKGSGVGFLAGYQYWRDEPDTGRFNYTTATSASDIIVDETTGQTILPGDSAPNSLNAHMLRLGVQGKANFGNFFDISAEVAAIPYAKVGGSVGIDDVVIDNSVYGGPVQFPYSGNGNIIGINSSPTELDGWGYGGAAELWVGMHPTENLTFRLGGRAWYIQGVADATYTRATIGNPGQTTAGPGNPYDVDPTFANGGVITTNNPFSMLRYGLLGEFTYKF